MNFTDTLKDLHFLTYLLDGLSLGKSLHFFFTLNNVFRLKIKGIITVVIINSTF